jgi:hypothetical protein
MRPWTTRGCCVWGEGGGRISSYTYGLLRCDVKLHDILEDRISNIHHFENLKSLFLADHFGSLGGWVGRISARIPIVLRFFLALLSPSGKIQNWHLKLNHVHTVLRPFQFINCNRPCDALTDGDLASHGREMTVRPHSRCRGRHVPVKSRQDILHRLCRECVHWRPR